MSRTTPFPLPKLGIDNVTHETRMKAGTVRRADNVDIAPDGAFRRRSGFRLLEPGDYHSLWRNPVTGIVFVCRGNEVCVIGAGRQLFPIATLPTSEPITYCEYNGATYWAHRRGLGWLPTDRPNGRAVGVPSTWYEVLRESPGSLPAGRYGVSVTAVDDRGEESAASPVEFIEVTQGGITVEGIVTDMPLVCVYITDVNGEILHQAIEAPASLPVYTVAECAKGGELDTRSLRPMPGGQLVAGHAGRLYVAEGSTLWFSEAMRPHLNSLAHGYIEMTGRITLLMAVHDGVYVGDQRGVWFLSGRDAGQLQPRLVNSAVALERSGVLVEATAFNLQVVESNTPVVVWLTAEGYRAGKAGGDVVPLNADRLRVARGAGRSSFVMRDGVKQVVSLVKSGLSAVGSAEDSQLLP